MIPEGRMKMPTDFIDMEKSYYPVSLFEGDTIDLSLFETKTVPTYSNFDPDTIELLDRDKYETPG
jgi:hypothetical protein